MNGAHRSKNGNWVIPNSFQTPNFFVDELITFLTPTETVVLLYAIRQILGYQDKIKDRRANISLSNFARCGLGQQAIRAAVKGLNQHNILITIGQPMEDGQLYELQEDEEKINWNGLKARRDAKERQGEKRTKKATKASLKVRGVTSDVMGNVGRNKGVTSDVNEGVTSDVDIKTQEDKPNLKPKDGAPAPPPPEPKELLRLDLTPEGRILQAEFERIRRGKGQSAILYYANEVQRDSYLKVFATLGKELKPLIEKGLARERTSRSNLLGWLEGCVKTKASTNGKLLSAESDQSAEDWQVEYERTKAEERARVKKLFDEHRRKQAEGVNSGNPD